jgi:hypothetical protein
MFILVFRDIEESTAVPRPPLPMIPIWMAEFALLPNAAAGLTMVTVDMAAVLLMKFLRLRCIMMCSLKIKLQDYGPAGTGSVLYKGIEM